VTGVLGVAALGGIGAAAVAHAATGANLPVLNIQQAAVTGSTTTTPKTSKDPAKADDRKVCDHDRNGKPDHHRAPLDDATAAKVKSAALAAVPGATVKHADHDRADGYVAMLVKSDGTTKVLVHEDKDFKVTKVQDPAPARGPGGPGGPGRRHDADGLRGARPESTPAPETSSAS